MDLGSISTSDLVRRCRQGEERAWREFAARYTRPVYALCLRMLRNPAEAEDATQDSFLRVHRYFGSFDPTRPVEPWLLHLAYHVCLARMQGRRPEVVADQSQAADELSTGGGGGEPGPEQALQQGERSLLLRKGLAALSPQDRAILHLHYWQGLSVAELSESVAAEASAVKVRLFRARSRLREALEPLMDGEREWRSSWTS